MPVIIRNSSPERWVKFPVPFEARLILPGLALAWAMNSGTVLAGNEGLTNRAKESLLMLATGTMSRVTVKGLFRRDRQGGRRLQVDQGYLGGYHHIAWPADADRPRRTRGVRARTHQGSNGRRPGACEGSRREVRSQTEAQPVPA